MSDVKFGDEIEKIHLLYFARVCEMIEQFTYVRWARNHALNNPTKCFEYRWIVDRSEIELYILDVNLIFTDSLLEFDLILIARIRLSQVDIGFVGEDEDRAVVSVFLFDIIVDTVEVINGLDQIWLWA